MIKILKEIFKSLSKNKVVLIGLAILVFLSSGVFTLLFGSLTNYKAKFNEYKKTSVLQDATVDLNVNFLGKIKDEGFDPVTDEQNLNVYTPISKNDKKETFFLTNTSTNFISLKNLGINIDNSENLFLKTDDLLETLNRNQWIQEKIYDINTNNNTFTPILANGVNFQLYRLQNGLKTPSKEQVTLSSTDTITFDKKYTFGEITSIKNGNVGIAGTKNSNDTLSSIFSLYINIKTKEATFDAIKGNTWEKEGVLYTLEPQEVAKLIGFVPFSEDDIKGYVLDEENIDNNTNVLFNIAKSNDADFDPNAINSYDRKFLVLNGDAKMIKNTIQLTHLANPVVGYANIYYSLSQNTPYRYDASWLVNKQTQVSYVYNKYRINFKPEEEENNNEKTWTGAYRKYIENLKKHNTKEYEYFKTFGFWEKVTKINTNGKISTIHSPLTIADFKVRIKNANGVETTIADIEKISNNNLNSIDVASYSNKNIKEERFIHLKNNVFNLAKKEILDEITNKNDTKVDYGVEAIGVRESLVSKSLDKDGNSKVFAFINAGNENHAILDHVNKVGQLVNESANNYENSRLFLRSDGAKIDNIEPIFASKIIAGIFNGFIPDENYFVANVRFVNYFDKFVNTNIEYKTVNEKIIVLSNIVNNSKKYAVTKKGESYFILSRPIDVSDDSRWTIDKENSGSNGLTIDELQNWLVNFSYTIDGTVGANGWLKEDSRFSNILSLPMVYRNILDVVTKEAVEKSSIDSVFENLTNAFVNSDLVTQGFMSEENVRKLLAALKQSSKQNNIVKLFINPEIDKTQIVKVLVDTFYIANAQNGKNFTNSIVSQFINNLISKITEAKYTGPKNNLSAQELKIKDLEAQKEYFNEEFDKLLQIFSKMFNADFLNIFGSEFKMQKVVRYITNIVEFVKHFAELINAVDFDKFIKQFHQWMIQKANKQNAKGEYYTLARDETIYFLLNSIDYEKFKNALISMVSLIDFNKMLNPDLPKKESIFDEIAKNIKDNSIKENIKDIFRNLNGAKNGEKAYSNVGNSLKNIIALIDFNKFVQNYKRKLVDKRYKDIYRINGKDVEVTYVEKTIKTQDLIAVLIKAISGDGAVNSFSQFKEALITLANLSGKVETRNGLILAPAPEKGKLGVDSLLSLTSLSANDLSAGIRDVQNIEKLLLNKKDISIKQANILKTYVGISDEQLANYDLVLSKIQTFNRLLQKTVAKEYVNNINPDKLQLLNRIDRDKVKESSFTLGDYMWKLFLARIQGDRERDGDISNSIKEAIKDQLGSSINTDIYGTALVSLKQLKLWLELAVKNPNISPKELFDFINYMIKLPIQDKALYDELNNQTLYGGEKNSVLLPVTRGLVQPLFLTDDLWRQNKNKNYTNPIIQRLYNKYKNQPAIWKWIVKNRYQLTVLWGKIASGQKIRNEYYPTIESMVNYAFDPSSNTAFTKDEILSALVLLESQSSFATNLLMSLGISPVIFDSYENVNFPQVAIWTNVDPDNQEKEGAGNLQFLIRNRLLDFSQIPLENISNYFGIFWNDEDFNLGTATYFQPLKLAIDNSWLSWVDKNILTDENGKDVRVFGLSIKKFIFDSLDSVLGFVSNNNIIVLNDPTSFVAKISENFAMKNNKEIYNGKIPNNLIEMEKLINSLPEKYIINVNNVKFIIVGYDNVVDYLYPVIDEDNLKINTQDQGLIFVNQKGFDRIRSNDRTAIIKEYALVKLKDNSKVNEFTEKANNYIWENFSNTRLKSAYATQELNPLAPERALRVLMIEQIFNTLSIFTTFISIVIGSLIVVSLLFITRRYIQEKSKVLGILKAQGYYSYEISIPLILFSFMSVLIGGVAGYIIGLFSQPIIQTILSSYWTVPVQHLTFDPITFSFSILIPLLITSIVIILSAIWNLRKKAIYLMNGLADLNPSSFKQKVAKIVVRGGIKTRFVATMGINTFWKIVALLLSTSLTAVSTIFSISSNGIFTKAVKHTYGNRKYNFKMNLSTPTKEGGPIKTYNKEDLTRLLYTPIGIVAESNSLNHNYFKPGRSLINSDGKNNAINGLPQENDPHVVTRSSIDIRIEKGGLSLSPWDIVYNSLPDSQKQKVLNLSNEAIKQLEKSQNLVLGKDGVTYYAGSEQNPQNYFKYFEVDKKFRYMVWNKEKGYYDENIIKTDSYRQQYRDFLVNNYPKINVNDYFISFSGLFFDNKENEKYSYASIMFDNVEQKINGYKPNSEYVQIYDYYGNDLGQELENYSIDSANPIYPLVINYVTSKKYGLSVGSEINVTVKNHINRYYNEITKQNANYNVKFKIIGIQDTYISEEFTTSQKVVNKITGLDAFEPDNAYNGVLSKSELPTQLLQSISLYSNSGFWASQEKIDLENNSKDINISTFKEIFADNTGVLDNIGLNKEQKQALLFTTDAKNALSANQAFDFSEKALSDKNYLDQNYSQIVNGLEAYVKVYGTSLYTILATDVFAKSIELGFVNSLSDSISYASIAIVIVFFIISMIILVIISKIIISENEKNISIFDILGYNEKEKFYMFFSIYAPIIVLASLLAIPFVIGIIAIFNKFIILSAGIYVPIVLKWWHVIISIFFTIFIFAIVSILSWRSLNKAKAIHLLKGK